MNAAATNNNSSSGVIRILFIVFPCGDLSFVSGSLLYLRRLHANYRRQTFQNCIPRLTAVCRSKELAAARAEVNASWLQAVRRKAVAQNCFQSVFLWQPISHRVPRLAGVSCAIESQLPFRRAAKLV